jgi:hypothetical protein
MLVTQLKKSIVASARKHLSNASAGRRVSVSDTDVFVTSYPKSGNTWVRFLIANMLHPDGTTDFYNINQRVPDIYTMPDRKLLELGAPRYLKSHEYFDPRYPQVLYVVRDVRSVVVSYYNHLQLIGSIADDESIDDFVKRFIDGKMSRYGSWKENVLSWIRVRGQDVSRFKLVRYEDLKADCVFELESISAFLNLDKSSQQLRDIAELSSFSRMKALEQNGIDKTMLSKRYRHVEGGFVRSGGTSDWKQALSPESIDEITKDCGDLLGELGYLP